MDENKYIYGLVVLLLLGVAVSYYVLTGPSRKENNINNDETTTTEQGELQIVDTVIGEGAEAVAGATVKVDYTGTLEDGTVFDSSVDRGEPFEFVLGSGMVIKGWDQGIEGMKVGGKRKLVIPPNLGYGDADMGTIPPNSTLTFEVELLEVTETETPAEVTEE